MDPQEVLRAAVTHGRVARFQAGPPPLEEVYLQLTGAGDGMPAAETVLRADAAGEAAQGG